MTLQGIFYIAYRSVYERHAPSESFLHVDDFHGPEDLAIYMRQLSHDPKKYHTHFLWKSSYKVEEVDISYEICKYIGLERDRGGTRKMASARKYSDLDKFWRPQGVCAKLEQ